MMTPAVKTICTALLGMGTLTVLFAADQRVQDDPDNTDRTRLASATHGVVGGKHDFSAITGKAGDACAACHVPHVQTARPQQADDESFNLSFYRIGGQREVLVPGRYMPGPSSLMCLSCHNGTVASSTIGSAHALLAASREGYAFPGGFAMRDHPIGVKFPTRMADFRTLAEVNAGGVVLPDGRVECISCHDPHNEAGIDKMLVKSNRRSALCLSCHKK